MRWAGHVAHTGGKEKCIQGYGVVDHLEGLGIGEGVLFKRNDVGLREMDWSAARLELLV